ncbi:MAG: alpha/beta hydrolase [Sandaracinus sp.]|nr:alpha/beta hydrolase [Sandaracinus sp.]
MQVAEQTLHANGLAHHVVTWTPELPKATLLLAHGFLDLAWSWKPVAERLASEGYRCVAWDWRGHGETEHVGAGGYYHFPDYVLDLAELFPQVAEGTTHLLGHSMGGTVSTMFAALRGEALSSLTLVEGIGPPPWPFERTAEKFEAWLDGMAKLRAKEERPMADLDAAVSRMRVQNPRLDDEFGRFLADKSTRPTEGGLVWRFDRRHRTTSPMPFRTELFSEFLRRVPVPVLYVAGEKGFRLPDEDARLALVPTSVKTHEIAGAGHMLHREEPEALCRAWLEFVG